MNKKLDKTEKAFFDWIKENVKKDWYVYDIGAKAINGEADYISLFVDIIDNGKIYGFDPIISENIKKNLDNIDFYRTFLSNKEGREIVDLEVISGGGDDIHTGEVEITVNKLDNLSIHKMDLIKMDIEGEELNALKGGERVIKTYRPIILLEFHWRGDVEFREETEEFLDSINYEIYTYKGNKVDDLKENNDYGIGHFILLPMKTNIKINTSSDNKNKVLKLVDSIKTEAKET